MRRARSRRPSRQYFVLFFGLCGACRSGPSSLKPPAVIADSAVDAHPPDLTAGVDAVDERPAIDLAATDRATVIDGARDAGGAFDFFVLSLSWAPSFCADMGAANPQECGPDAHFGFVVHGLWPQNDPTGYPESCIANPPPVPSDVVTRMLAVMPGTSLITHEWQKHGTCTGLDVASYFDTVLEAFKRVQIPASLRSPHVSTTVTAADLESLFTSSNPGLTAAGVSVVCAAGRLSEIRLCVQKDLSWRDCPAGVPDQCSTAAILPPVP